MPSVVHQLHSHDGFLMYFPILVYAIKVISSGHVISFYEEFPSELNGKFC